MKTTPDNIAAWSRLAEDDDYDFPAGIVRALIADLEEAQQDLATADEKWVFFQDLCKAHGCDGITAMAAELTATRKQLEEAQAAKHQLHADLQNAFDSKDKLQARLAAAEKDAARWKERAEFEYSKQMYPDNPGLAVGALDAHMRVGWTWDGKQKAIDAAIAAQEGK